MPTPTSPGSRFISATLPLALPALVRIDLSRLMKQILLAVPSDIGLVYASRPREWWTEPSSFFPLMVGKGLPREAAVVIFTSITGTLVYATALGIINFAGIHF